jgi:hypothetical protein
VEVASTRDSRGWLAVYSVPRLVLPVEGSAYVDTPLEHHGLIVSIAWAVTTLMVSHDVRVKERARYSWPRMVPQPKRR